jgi:hypothetical protein
MKDEDIERVMKEWFPSSLPRSTQYIYRATTGWTYEDTHLYVYDAAADYYWCKSISAEAIHAAHTFGDVYGLAMTQLRDMVWSHEDQFVRGYD